MVCSTNERIILEDFSKSNNFAVNVISSSYIMFPFFSLNFGPMYIPADAIA